MKKSDEKKALCVKHRELLQIVVRFGKGVMLLKQLRTICLRTGLYPNEQAVNRAVRNLRAVGLLTRQTWVDGNSDLVLARKGVYEFLQGVDSQNVATPPRPSTMAPYILQARKVDWLLRVMENRKIDNMEAVENLFLKQSCTVFLRQNELLDFYQRRQPAFSAGRSQYDTEVKLLMEDARRQELWAKHLPQPENCRQAGKSITLKTLHQRGIYLSGISHSQSTVVLVLFTERTMGAKRLMDWTIDTCWWVRWMFPGFRVKLKLYVLDAAHEESLTRALNAKTRGRAYWHARLAAERIDGMLMLSVYSTDFINRWCGGVRAV